MQDLDDVVELNEEDLQLVSGGDGVFIGGIINGVTVGLSTVPGVSNIVETPNSVSFSLTL